MNKSQSETRFRSGMVPRPNIERRHNTVSHAPHKAPYNDSGTRKKQRAKDEDKPTLRRPKDGEIEAKHVFLHKGPKFINPLNLFV